MNCNEVVHERTGFTSRRAFIASAGAAIALGVGLPAIRSEAFAKQESTPVDALDPTSRIHPAALFEGSCASLGQIVFPLADVGIVNSDPGNQQGGEIVGPPSAVPVLQSITELPVALDQVLAAPRAIAVGRSPEDAATIIACGNVGGTRVGDTVMIGLGEHNDSGYGGVALLNPAEPGWTNVVIYLTPPATMPTAGATPTSGEAPAAGAGAAPAEVTVESVDIDFNPNEFSIPANTDVTLHLPNNGSALHNFSVTDHNNPDVPNLGIDVDIPPGQRQTITVNAPAGDYYYFCDVPGHEAAGMFGTMHVE
ncbi:MAG: cupredoxin domain-containing protein [Chloroflexota bacterium]|nr:cupredoxin domain-containing protein [Chloroflexota bacterium]